MFSRKTTMSIIFLSFAQFAFSTHCHCQQLNSGQTSEDLRKSIDTIKNITDITRQTELTKQIYESTKTQQSQKFNKTDIEIISNLLDINVDSVRYWAARAVGNFKNRAEFLLPKLKSLLSTLEEQSQTTAHRGMKESLTSVSALKFAIIQIRNPSVSSPPK